MTFTTYGRTLSIAGMLSMSGSSSTDSGFGSASIRAPLSSMRMGESRPRRSPSRTSYAKLSVLPVVFLYTASPVPVPGPVDKRSVGSP